MVKVVKLQLFYKGDELLSFKKMQETLWGVQRETREVANRTIQMCWDYNNFSQDWKKKYNAYPTKEQETEIMDGRSFEGAIYNSLKEYAPSMNTANLSCVTRMAFAKFKQSKADIMRGDMTVPSYKKNIPLELAKKSIALSCERDENGAVSEWIFLLSLISNAKKSELGVKDGRFKFKAVVPARSRRYVQPILERCLDGEYTICGSKLKYDNGKWFLMLSYQLEKKPENLPLLDANSIMSVHIGAHNAVSCGFSFSDKTLNIEGGEVLAFAAQVENRRRQIGRASRKDSELCGDGRKGHGYHAKMKPLDKIGNKIANFRNTVNHRYSRQIIKWAVENKCGVIQLEDLTNFATTELEKYKLLRGWSYYDLQEKIKNKAMEYNIEVIPVPYKDLQTWCPDCSEAAVKRVTDANGEEAFVCSKCGQTYDVDKLTAKNITIPNIADLLLARKTENKDAKTSKSKAKEKK